MVCRGSADPGSTPSGWCVDEGQRPGPKRSARSSISLPRCSVADGEPPLDVARQFDLVDDRRPARSRGPRDRGLPRRADLDRVARPACRDQRNAPKTVVRRDVRHADPRVRDAAPGRTRAPIARRRYPLARGGRDRRGLRASEPHGALAAARTRYDAARRASHGWMVRFDAVFASGATHIASTLVAMPVSTPGRRSRSTKTGRSRRHRSRPAAWRR